MKFKLMFGKGFMVDNEPIGQTWKPTWFFNAPWSVICKILKRGKL